MQDKQGVFRAEANELLAELEDSLLDLQKNLENLELAGKVFRAMHTIKSSGAMFGFADISVFANEVKTVYDLVLGGEISVTKELTNFSLKARDHIKAMLNGEDVDKDVQELQSLELVAAFRTFLPTEEKPLPQASKRIPALQAGG